MGGHSDEEVPQDVDGLTVEGAYSRVAEAIDRPGFVLHSTIEATQTNLVGRTTEPVYAKQLWIDTAEGGAARMQIQAAPNVGFFDTPFDAIYVSGTVYTGYLYDSVLGDRALLHDVPNTDLCPGTRSLPVALVLECYSGGGVETPGVLQASQTYIEPRAEYDGVAGIAVVFQGDPEEQKVRQGPGGPEVAVTYLTTIRVYLDPDTFLPSTRVLELRQDGQLTFQDVSVYSHEFVSLDLLPTDFLEPESLRGGS